MDYLLILSPLFFLDILNRAPENNGSDKTPLEVIQLERHNERLKDALLRYVLFIIFQNHNV